MPGTTSAGAVVWPLVRVALYAAVVVILFGYYWPDPPPPDDGSRDGIVYEIVEVMTAFVLIIVTGAMVALGELAAHLHRDRRRRLAAERGEPTTR
ncbi:hypothetical protein [Nocardioides lijunqiniae]|uniref:hypothetical protein n=1 Tax=Nocardioides lijunqiniae TaxID=2760832 RepID=UPI001877AA62|nr:hypothetical protein [Nocardioides lijunqiniae]